MPPTRSSRARANRGRGRRERRLAVLALATCVLLWGCGFRQGMENIDEAKQAKKQAEDVQHRLEKDLKKGQDSLIEAQ